MKGLQSDLGSFFLSAYKNIDAWCGSEQYTMQK